MNSDRVLLFMLRANAAILLLAAPCALLPFDWMDAVHRNWLGLGSLPNAVIARYLTRSLSLVYAMRGAVVLAVTLDWQRYRPIVPVLAWLHVSFGCAMLVVDLDAGLPWWWTASEGPSLATYGMAVLLVYRRASRNEPGVP
jgi:hypothetical protein